MKFDTLRIIYSWTYHPWLCQETAISSIPKAMHIPPKIPIAIFQPSSDQETPTATMIPIIAKMMPKSMIIIDQSILC